MTKKGILFYRFLVFTQDEDLFEENWCIFIYDTSSKEMLYLFGEQNEQLLNKMVPYCCIHEELYTTFEAIDLDFKYFTHENHTNPILTIKTTRVQ